MLESGRCAFICISPFFAFFCAFFCFQFLHLCEERGRDCHPIDSRERDDLIDSMAGVVVPSGGSPRCRHTDRLLMAVLLVVRVHTLDAHNPCAGMEMKTLEQKTRISSIFDRSQNQQWRSDKRDRTKTSLFFNFGLGPRMVRTLGCHRSQRANP